LERAGLRTDDPIIADGKLPRFHVTGDKPGTRNGWYVLHADGIPAGAFGNWKEDVTHCWCSKLKRPLSQVEHAALRRRFNVAQATCEAERVRARQDARVKAEHIWNRSAPARPDHPYLARKRVKPHGLREWRGNLVIPIRDIGGALHALQFITSSGDNRFLPGGAIRGHFHVIGDPPGRAICICEGYATGATIFEETGYPTIVAFNAKNFSPVAQAMRAAFPKLRIVMCADNDCETPGNPGFTEATKAAKLIGRRVAEVAA
jgi:putative DNA primase/helicase